MNFDYNGPFKATVMWNETVALFKNGMPLSEHRYLLHKYKNSFTGREAIDFLQKALESKKLFETNVSRIQVRMLLQQFMKSNLIRPVKCFKNNEFIDSPRHIYEFTDELYNFKVRHPFSNIGNTLSKQPNEQFKVNQNLKKEHEVPRTFEFIWKTAVINRLKEYVKIKNLDASIPYTYIEDNWIVINGNPAYVKEKWKTELPYWVLSAIHNLLCFSQKTVAYPEFDYDVFKVILEFFESREEPVIPHPFYNLFKITFQFFDETDSSIISPNSFGNKNTKNYFESVISPVNNTEPISRETKETVQFINSEHVDGNNLRVQDNYKYYHPSLITPKSLPYFPQMPRYSTYKDGIVNRGFISSSSDSDFQNNIYSKPIVDDDKSQQTTNSLTLKVNNIDRLSLDYNLAIQTISNLMHATKTDQPSTTLSDDDSYYTAYQYEDSHSSNEFDEFSFNRQTDDFTVNWSENLIKKAVNVFQLLLMLIPPKRRAQLKYLILIINCLPKISRSTNLSKENIIEALKKAVLRPLNDVEIDDRLSKRIIYFLSISYKQIFLDLSKDDIKSINILEENIFCERVSFEYFEQQKIVSSSNALNELLDYILHDKNMNEKDRKKRLKLFKESYPQIYQNRFNEMEKKRIRKRTSSEKVPTLLRI